MFGSSICRWYDEERRTMIVISGGRIEPQLLFFYT